MARRCRRVVRHFAERVRGARLPRTDAGRVLERIVEAVEVVRVAAGAVLGSEGVRAEPGIAQPRHVDVRVEAREALADRIDRQQGVGNEVGLPSQRQRAIRGIEPSPGLAVEQAVALGLGAGVGIDAAFEPEQGLPAAAERFLTLDAPAAGVVDAAARGYRGSRVVRRNRCIVGAQAAQRTKADIEDAVQVDAGLGRARCARDEQCRQHA